jgi:predicted double-glycine peptidase
MQASATIASLPLRGLFVALGAMALAPAHAEPATSIFLDGGGGYYQTHPGHSLRDSHFKHVVRQEYDFSCGSAALATLLTYHYGHPVDESSVLEAMFEIGDQAKIRREGFSLLDMKNYLESIGYHAEGYRESLDKLSHVGIPAIVLINRKGYMHFVVVQGVTQDQVSVADPTLGLRIYDRADFEKMWSGILFVVLNDKKIANATFNVKDDWSTNGNPNFRHMLDRSDLASLTVDTSITPNYY